MTSPRTSSKKPTPVQIVGESRARELEQSAQSARLALQAWWANNARDLPWRNESTTPWGVLVCEVMSQQTQMSRVVPYWNAWMAQWPDAAALAQADKAGVIRAWGRLGYPRRALRLQECAQQVAAQYDDRLPSDYDELLALPGIGDYTASAVLSFAFGKRVAVIDTNIRRVLSRAFLGIESLGGSCTPLERALAWVVLPKAAGESAVWNQAVMELGAIVCTAKQPLCEQCPLRAQCAFVKAGMPGLGERRTRPRQKFAGTDRQVRGKIMQALRALPTGQTLQYKDAQKLCDDAAQLDRCIASLDEDGLIEIVNGHDMRLPA